VNKKTAAGGWHPRERGTPARTVVGGRLSVRKRAGALDEDWPEVLAALRRGLKSEKSMEASRTAIAYVQLVYGRELQQPKDEASSADPLDVSAMTRERRDALKRRILAQHPHLVQQLRGEDIAGDEA
jgi:hypothetical protein